MFDILINTLLDIYFYKQEVQISLKTIISSINLLRVAKNIYQYLIVLCMGNK